MTSIKVSFSHRDFQARAEQLAATLGLELSLTSSAVEDPQGYYLNLGIQGLSLIPCASKSHGPITCQFDSGANSHRRKFGGGNGQAIAKATGVSGKFKPGILDLTAGMGGDSFVLASLGCEVQMLERNAIVFNLLQDGIARASQSEDSSLREIIARMALLSGDARSYLQVSMANDYADVIYMDPMFPERKKSAKVKKEMQAFHQIVGADEDAAELLPLALERARYRLVIKRSTSAGYLADLQPSYSLEGKSTRFDIFALRKLPD